MTSARTKRPAARNKKVVYISFSSEVSPQTTEALLAICADQVNKGVSTVNLLLSTPGGSVLHGMNIYNVLRGMPFNLITHNVGSVNSIGNVVFLAGEKRYVVPNGTFMFHGVGFDIKQPMRLEEKLLRERLDSIDSDQRKIAAIINDRASFPDKEEVASLFLQAATKDPEYARSHGLVHEIREVSIPRGTPVIQLVFKR